MSKTSPRRRIQLLQASSALLVALGAVYGSGNLEAAPVYHELFTPLPADDLRLGALSRTSVMPAVMQTRSGLVSLDDFAQQKSGVVYQASADHPGYRLDGVTQAPDRLSYDDPFIPRLTPYKRSAAFDTFDENFVLQVADLRGQSVVAGGQLQPGYDGFFAKFQVQVGGKRRVALPSVGPGTQLLALELTPAAPYRLFRDSAENLSLLVEEEGVVQVALQMAIDRRSFGSQFLPVSFASLAPYLPTLPRQVADAGRAMAEELHFEREPSPAHLLQKLVAYFRDFREAEDAAIAAQLEARSQMTPEEIFFELTRKQEGVCRHRAYAFTLMALSLGIPTRFVHNEAHAWVEVFDSQIWHRIDLGGAPGALQQTRAEQRAPNYQAPSDPYSWPASSRPGSSLAVENSGGPSGAGSAQESGRGDEQAGSGDSSVTQPRTTGSASFNGGAASNGSSSFNGAAATPGGGASPGSRDNSNGEVRAPRQPSDLRERALVEFSGAADKVRRGHLFQLAGKATLAGEVCSQSRVDIYLTPQAGGERRFVGSLATDQAGNFSGSLQAPAGTQVGYFTLSAEVAAGCFTGRSQLR